MYMRVINNGVWNSTSDGIAARQISQNYQFILDAIPSSACMASAARLFIGDGIIGWDLHARGGGGAAVAVRVINFRRWRGLAVAQMQRA